MFFFCCDDDDGAVVSVEWKQLCLSLKAKPMLCVSLCVLLASYSVVVFFKIKPTFKSWEILHKNLHLYFFLMK